jgi:hypothetical protein
VNSLAKPFSGFGIVVTQQMGLRGADEGHYQDTGSTLRPLAWPWPGAVQ